MLLRLAFTNTAPCEVVIAEHQLRLVAAGPIDLRFGRVLATRHRRRREGEEETAARQTVATPRGKHLERPFVSANLAGRHAPFQRYAGWVVACFENSAAAQSRRTTPGEKHRLS